MRYTFRLWYSIYIQVLVYGINLGFRIRYTVDSRYLEFDWTMKKIRVNRSSTQEELRRYGSVVCLTTKGRQLERNFEELKPVSHVPILGKIFFSLLNSLNLVERLVTSRYLFCVYDYVYMFCLCFSAVALSLNFTHHDVFFFVQYCLFTINCVFLLFNKVQKKTILL